MRQTLQCPPSYLLSRGIPQTLSTLEASLVPGSIIASQQAEAQRIDTVVTNGHLFAESRCQKLKMEGVQFSAETFLPHKQVFFWQLAIKRLSGKYIRSNRWKRAKAVAGILEPISCLTLEDLRLRLTAAMAAYRKARKSHESSRLHFIESFSPKVRDRILRCKEQRRLGRISKMVNQHIHNGSVTRILRTHIIDGSEVEEECITPDAITDALLEANESKYHQCDASPFLQQPLLDDFGFLGDTPAAEAVLNGTYQPPDGTPPLVALLLRHVASPSTFPPGLECPDFVSTQDHQRSW